MCIQNDCEGGEECVEDSGGVSDGSAGDVRVASKAHDVGAGGPAHDGGNGGGYALAYVRKLVWSTHNKRSGEILLEGLPHCCKQITQLLNAFGPHATVVDPNST